jgi:hypothetical protein
VHAPGDSLRRVPPASDAMTAQWTAMTIVAPVQTPYLVLGGLPILFSEAPAEVNADCMPGAGARGQEKCWW